jgi:hypothetical protein
VAFFEKLCGPWFLENFSKKCTNKKLIGLPALFIFIVQNNRDSQPFQLIMSPIYLAFHDPKNTLGKTLRIPPI